MQFLRQQRNGRKRKSYLEKIGLNHKIQTVDEFNRNYKILNELEGGAQGTIHIIQRKLQTSEEKKETHDDIEDHTLEGNETQFETELVVKIIDLNDIDDIEMELIEALSTYELTSNTYLLNHHGIYYDEKQKQLLIVTEKLKSNLAQFKHCMSHNKLNEEQLKSIMSDILNKLYILHNTGHIHCDINPSNVMCDHKDEWKLIDFDMAMKIDHDKGYVTDTWKGTIGWVSKEVGYDINSSNNQYSYSSDIWSLGLILLYILNDFHNPFELTQQEIIENKLKDESHKLEYYYKYKMTQTEHQNKLQCLLITWFVAEKISFHLYDLLLNHLLVFNVLDRAQSCLDIMYHPWFYSHIKQNRDKYAFSIDRFDTEYKRKEGIQLC